MKIDARWKVIFQLMELLRRLDRKSSDLVWAIDEEGLNDKDYSRNYNEIGARFVKLHGTDQNYLSDEIGELIELILKLIKYDWPEIKVELDNLYDLFFGLDTKEYVEQRNDLLVKLASDPTILNDLPMGSDYDEDSSEEEFQDDDIEDAEYEDEDIEDGWEEDASDGVPILMNLDSNRWFDVSSNKASYILERDDLKLYGVIIPEQLYPFFKMRDDFIDDEKSSDDYQWVLIKFRRSVHPCKLYKKNNGAICLSWGNKVRRSIVSKHPECFDYFGSEHGKKHAVITIDSSRLEQDEFYTMTSVGTRIEE
jgi:hypothetical protein